MLSEEWKLIYEFYSKQLFLYALSLTGNKQEAEDLLQETFVKAYLSYQNIGSIKSWLIIVLRNQFLNLQRDRKRVMHDDGTNLVDYRYNDEDMLEKIIRSEERRQLFQAIQMLPQQMREVLMESVYFQLKDDEISKLHGITKESVRKIRSRAKAKMIDALKEGK